MYLVSEIKHVEETQVEDAVEAEEARHGGYLGAGVRREGEGGEGGRGGGGGAQRGGGDGRGALAEEESGEGGGEGGRLRRQEVLVKHHKRVIGGRRPLSHLTPADGSGKLRNEGAKRVLLGVGRVRGKRDSSPRRFFRVTILLYAD